MPEDQVLAGDLAEVEFGQFGLGETASILPHDHHRFVDELRNYRRRNSLVRVFLVRLQHNPVDEDTVIHDVVDC